MILRMKSRDFSSVLDWLDFIVKFQKQPYVSNYNKINVLDKILKSPLYTN